jgi:class 3 adenylate cyclase
MVDAQSGRFQRRGHRRHAPGAGAARLALRVVIKDQITRNTLNTFHGPLVGGRILSGLIKRGTGERLAAALWYSDLRNSTGLADALPVEAFLDLLNVYFDCAAGAVMEEGGHVLDIIGDAILAFFPASASSEAEACASALRAAQARRRGSPSSRRKGMRGRKPSPSASACISAMWCSATPARASG